MVDVLKPHIVRVKTEGVKDGFDKVFILLGSYTKVKEKLHAEWCARVDHTACATAQMEGNLSSVVLVMENKIMDVWTNS